jgi:hypothetical protein
MTLVGLLPPICDNGQLLVDGGYSEQHFMSLLSALIHSRPVQWIICRYVPRISRDSHSFDTV